MADAFDIHLTPDRSEVLEKIKSLPDGWRIVLKRPPRSLQQNAHMWAMLTDISEQVIWYGEHLSREDWKNVLTASLRKSRTVPTIDGDGLVPLGLYTSEMSDEEMNMLLALIQAFGDEQGVRWKAYPALQAQADAQRTAKVKP
jgi:NinB protein